MTIGTHIYGKAYGYVSSLFGEIKRGVRPNAFYFF